MRAWARHMLLVWMVMLLAGCGLLNQSSGPPPLLFPTARVVSLSGQLPLSIYVAVDSTGIIKQHSIYAFDATFGHLRWHFDRKALLQPFPLLVDHLLYASGDNKALYAINVEDGSVRWTHTSDGVPTIELVDQGIVFVGTGTSRVGGPPTALYALSATDGSLLWQAQVAGSVSAVSNGIVYISTAQGDLYALAASDGSARWHFHTGGQTSIPQTANGVVYAFASQPNRYPSNDALFALNSSDGSLKWRYPAQNTGANVAPISIENGVIYLISDENSTFGMNAVFALNASDASLRWHTAVSANASIISSALVDGTLYLGANDGNAAALNASSGSVLWQKRVGSSFAEIQVASQGVIYFSVLNEGLTALKVSDGSRLWRYPISEGFLIAAQLLDGHLYGTYSDANPLSPQSSYLFSLNAADGTLKWRYDVGQSLFGFPIVG